MLKIISFLAIIICSLQNAAAFNLNAGSNSYTVEVASFKQMRFHNVIRQERDFSCGSAALATLLKYSYGRDAVEEKTILEAMLADGDREKIKREGFSMLDMKNYLGKIGFVSDGYKISLDKLQAVTMPAIALINSRGYRHFVVVGGISDNTVIIRDPAFGNRAITRQEFEKIWNGVFFIIQTDKELARKTFQGENPWLKKQTDLANNILNSGSLADLALNSIRSSNYFNF